ncbi:MAG: YeeE/YedE family protein [Burkholderiales bacterium]
MSIDWTSFTPASAAAGGVLIGLAAAILLLWNGRVAGVSGIAGGLLRPSRGDVAWRAAFLAGLVAAPLCYAIVRALPPVRFDVSITAIAAAGLLVGVGTRIGSGCTSGHGICGISRLSPRSLVATMVFMASGVATVFVVRHVLRTFA